MSDNVPPNCTTCGNSYGWHISEPARLQPVGHDYTMPAGEVQTVVTGLREWTATYDADVRAAVELVIEHGHWLRDTKFLGQCVYLRGDGMAWIRWTTVADLLERRELIGSSGEIAVLKAAVMIARDTLGLSSLDRTNRALVVKAISDALGVA